jgi:6-pyruvoyltetrahydropterin/6-carboxytetrahydropterin synthase
MMQAVRRLQFCAGHRLLNHEGKCRHVHGHNYVALFYAEADHLDALGRVIDFSVLKEKIGGWIEEHWDHSFIYFTQDDQMAHALDVAESKCFALFENPTAENLASYLLERVCPLVLESTGVRVVKVELWETENCKVEVKLP